MGYFYYPVIFDYPVVFSKPCVQHDRIIEETLYLKDDNNEQKKVCAIMYRHTLGYANGLHEPKIKVSEEDMDVIRKHIIQPLHTIVENMRPIDSLCITGVEHIINVC